MTFQDRWPTWQSGALFGLFRLLTIAQSYPWSATVLVDELDAGSL
jgi:hypothetical protein